MAFCSLCKNPVSLAICKIDILTLHKECMNYSFPEHLQGHFFHYKCFILKYRIIVANIIKRAVNIRVARRISNNYVYYNILFTYNRLFRYKKEKPKRNIIRKSSRRVLFPPLKKALPSQSEMFQKYMEEYQYIKDDIEEICEIICSIKTRMSC